MSLHDLKWSKSEKKIARLAFDAAYHKECDSIKSKLNTMIDGASVSRDIWHVHDYLTEQRELTDEKYDYRYSQLLFVLARLLGEGWLTEDDLEGLEDDKINAIRGIADFGR